MSSMKLDPDSQMVGDHRPERHSKQVVMSVSVVCVCVLTPYTMLFLLLGKKESPWQQSLPLPVQPCQGILACIESRQNEHSSELVDAQGASFRWEARVVLSP